MKLCLISSLLNLIILTSTLCTALPLETGRRSLSASVGGTNGIQRSCKESGDSDDKLCLNENIPLNDGISYTEEEETTSGNERNTENCKDTDHRCETWADMGECDANPNYMIRFCEKSCKVCTLSDTAESEGSDDLDTGVAQDGNDVPTRRVVDASERYLREEVMTDSDKYSEEIQSACKNKHAMCAFWASIGECDANAGYMKIDCALACQTCDLFDVRVRCPRNLDAVNATGPGDLNRMFERVANAGSDVGYTASVLSSPDPDSDSVVGPWVVTFDSFLSEEECDHLIVLGGNEGFERSTGVGKLNFDGTHEATKNDARTSTNAWCGNDCLKDPVTQRVMNRIANLTGVPETNQEHFQLLKYDVGQYYRLHHDYIGDDRDSLSGPRILTFFLYLNDVEEGGGTDFPTLGITVTPKKGMGLLWPSVLDEQPLNKDYRTDHEALPVKKGTKYAANAWIHMRDFKTANQAGC